MNNKPLCFVISPIGEAGTQTRQDADDLLELIIKPVLDVCGMDVVRGDHRSEANQIDIDVIKSVQDAELCVADISLPNPNVYYEVGRRDETGKPIILLKSKHSDLLPVDIGTRRYIEYDLDSRRGIGDARQQLRNFIEPLIRSGFESAASGASLGDIASALQRVERKLDRLASSGGTAAVSGAGAPPVLQAMPSGSDPKDVFKLAVKQKNIPMMEEALERLRVSMDKWSFLDYYVESAASRGSEMAGNLLIENASAFFDESDISFRKKVEYLSSLVSYCNAKDLEREQLPLIEDLCSRLIAASEGAAVGDVATVYNQRNRMYYGLYITTEDESWLIKAIEELERVTQLVPEETYPFYNLASCYMHLTGHMGEAKSYIDRVLMLDEQNGKKDDGHLQTAYKIYRAMDDPGMSDILEKLRQVNPVKAALLEMQ